MTLVVAGLPTYVFPVVDTPHRSDVIVVLGPAVETRVNFALRLAEDRFADRIVISVPPIVKGSQPWPAPCTQPPAGIQVDCFTPRPFTTQGEARMLHTLSGPWRIERAIIITNTPHISRARLLFQRCFDGNLYFLTDGSKLGATDWMYQYAYQSAAFVKAALTTEC